MYLGIRTDSPVAELCLYDGSELLSEKFWQADRQLAFGLLAQIESFLAEQSKTFDDLTGLFIYRGPGSFTGLRIGITTMNTAAYAKGISIVGADGESWHKDAVARLEAGENDHTVLPHYGAEARITKPKK